MQTEPNADLLYFDGYCPACSLNGKQQKLLLNSNDFWECENSSCRLQLTTFVPYAAILRWRGEGKFRQTTDYAHNYHDKLILTGVGREAGQEIFPDPREAFYHRIELEEYVETIYINEETYQNDKYDPNDPILKRQAQYLETVATEEWVDLIDLYKELKNEGMESDSFHAFHQKLYEQKIIFSFKWSKWTEGIKALQDPTADFSNCSSLEISMYLTTIFRADRFSIGTIQQCMDNGVLNELIGRLEAIT